MPGFRGLEESMEQIIEMDVLVIGAGGAGCVAAIEGKRQGARVFLLSKDLIGYGDTRGSGGAIAAAFGTEDPQDNPEKHFQDTVRGGEWLNDQELVRTLTERAQMAVINLERYGNIFERQKDNPEKYWSHKMGGHRFPRTLENGLSAGIELGHCLRETVQRYDVDFMERIMVTALLTQDGRVVGATGIDTISGEFWVFRAKEVIMANGGAGELFAPHTTTSRYNTGDGYVMAYRVGAELMDMEMVQFMPYALTHPESMAGRQMGEPELAGKYGQLLNALGERIMKKYDPELMELSTRARVAAAIAREVKEGRGTNFGGCLLDLRENRKDPDFLYHFKTRRKIRYETVKIAYGLNAAELGEPWDVYPTQHYFMGGIRVDTQCRSNVPGLWAAGQAQGGVHGANRLGTNSLIEVFVFGMLAGRNAARNALQKSLLPIPAQQVADEKNRIYGIRDRKPQKGLEAFSLRKRLHKLAWDQVGVVRDGEGLKKATGELEDIRSQLSMAYLSSTMLRCNPEWVEYLETLNMADLTEMIVRSALMRQESRGAHYRVDYPDRDDKEWLKNVIMLKDGDRMKLYTVPVKFSFLKPEEKQTGR